MERKKFNNFSTGNSPPNSWNYREDIFPKKTSSSPRPSATISDINSSSHGYPVLFCFILKPPASILNFFIEMIH